MESACGRIVAAVLALLWVGLPGVAVAEDAAHLARNQAEQIALSERKARDAEASAAAAREAQAEAERRLEEQRQREEAERARTRTVTGSREAIVASVQKELVEMLRANPTAARVRVRIVIDGLGPGES